MRKENTFFSSLFGAKGKAATKSQPTPVVVTSYSQPHVLRQRMRELARARVSQHAPSIGRAELRLREALGVLLG